MRREPTSRWLTEYNFYTHSILLFLSGACRSGGAFESCAVTEEVVPERSTFSVFWSLLRIPFIFVFYFLFVNLNPLLKYFNFI